MRIVLILAGLAVLGAFSAPPAAAQDAQTPAVLQQQVDELKERVAKLEAALAALQAGPPAPAPAPAPAAAPVLPSEPVSPIGAGTAASSAKVFNPDMAVIGNFLGVGGKNPVDPSKAFEMRETEASFQAAVDPYARADFFLSFGESGVDLEEGFITFTTLPGGLLVRPARCARPSARSTPCTRTCCRGPIGRS